MIIIEFLSLCLCSKTMLFCFWCIDFWLQVDGYHVGMIHLAPYEDSNFGMRWSQYLARLPCLFDWFGPKYCIGFDLVPPRVFYTLGNSASPHQSIFRCIFHLLPYNLPICLALWLPSNISWSSMLPVSIIWLPIQCMSCMPCNERFLATAITFVSGCFQLGHSCFLRDFPGQHVCKPGVISSWALKCL